MHQQSVETPFDDFPQHWEASTLGAVAKRCGGDIQTGPFGSQLHASDYVPEGIPSVMPQNIGDNRILPDGIAKITEQDAIRLARYRLKKGDIVYSRRGDVEKRSIVRQTEDGWLCGTGCLRVRFNGGDVLPEYAAYYLGHPFIREWIVRHAVGATMPNLNTSILSAVPFLVPPRTEQEQIVASLCAIDDRIELNKQQNTTLEAMAQTIFKSWFVDFDPVKAKAEGRQPEGMDAATTALFPSRLVESDLGLIPKGWAVSPIGSLTHIVGGSTPSTKNSDFWCDNGHAWATPKDLSSLSSPVLLDTERHISDTGLQQISSGLLPEGSVLLSSRAPIGYVAITTRPTAINQGFIGLLCTEVPNIFVWRWVLCNLDAIKARANGSTFLEISKSNFRPLPVIVPTPEVLRAYDSVVQPIWDKIVLNTKQTKQLTDLRDTLLPRLISGKLRIGGDE